ncbi:MULTISPECIES: hypothetical protein [unclassified Stenotrophomonas]|uniref:hypothetical protein n=1 Tax=unclassified Stenotrophomonas TaxID=196198 RepID=UPI0011B27532|nr:MULTISPECIES: hypothetical protein [unclassified Stenotrophomonas]
MTANTICYCAILCDLGILLIANGPSNRVLLSVLRFLKIFPMPNHRQQALPLLGQDHKYLTSKVCCSDKDTCRGFFQHRRKSFHHFSVNDKILAVEKLATAILLNDLLSQCSQGLDRFTSFWNYLHFRELGIQRYASHKILIGIGAPFFDHADQCHGRLQIALDGRQIWDNVGKHHPGDRRLLPPRPPVRKGHSYHRSHGGRTPTYGSYRNPIHPAVRAGLKARNHDLGEVHALTLPVEGPHSATVAAREVLPHG